MNSVDITYIIDIYVFLIIYYLDLAVNRNIREVYNKKTSNFSLCTQVAIPSRTNWEII